MILKLKKEIFDLSDLEIALADYYKIAEIHIESSSDYWLCHFVQCEYDMEQTMYEFENYIIDLMNCKNT